MYRALGLTLKAGISTDCAYLHGRTRSMRVPLAYEDSISKYSTREHVS